MLQNYQDAMAICRWAGYPDIFVTFTCNPAWPEITRFCTAQDVTPADRPEILTRIFKLKLQALIKFLKEGKIFGAVRGGMIVIFSSFCIIFILIFCFFLQRFLLSSFRREVFRMLTYFCF